MLSYKNGKPFAAVKMHGKIKNVYIHDGSQQNHDYQYDQQKLNKLDRFDLKALKDALEKEDSTMLGGKLKQTYSKINNNGDLGKDISNAEAVRIIPTEDPAQRDSMLVCGPSGSGKSVFCSQFVDEYLHRYPKRPVILFSAKPEDEALDRYKPIRIPLTRNLVDDPVSLDELEKSLVIFDDIDQIGDKEIQNAVWNLRDRILEVGRSKGISICTVAHQINNYKASRICLNEADYVVFFPRSGAKYQINYFLKTYAGMDKEQIKKVFATPTRWMVLKKSYPMCVIHQSGIYIP